MDRNLDTVKFPAVEAHLRLIHMSRRQDPVKIYVFKDMALKGLISARHILKFRPEHEIRKDRSAAA